MSLSNSKRQKRFYEKQKEQGLVQVLVWVRPEDREKVRAYAKSLSGQPASKS